MIVGLLISRAAALWDRSSCSKYSKQRSASGLTGAQTARMILDRNGHERQGRACGRTTSRPLRPETKVIRLSEDLLQGQLHGRGSAWPPTRSGTRSGRQRLRAHEAEGPGSSRSLASAARSPALALIMAFFVGGAASPFPGRS